MPSSKIEIMRLLTDSLSDRLLDAIFICSSNSTIAAIPCRLELTSPLISANVLFLSIAVIKAPFAILQFNFMFALIKPTSAGLSESRNFSPISLARSRFLLNVSNSFSVNSIVTSLKTLSIKATS